jgi:hypothetical protein
MPLSVLPDYPSTREYLLGGTIAFMWLINLSVEGFKISRSICIQVLSDALPLEGVPIGVTRVSNNVHLSTTCISCVYSFPIANLCVERHIFIALRRRNSLYPEKNNPQFYAKESDLIPLVRNQIY